MKNRIKKLGYGVSIHYNCYRKLFEVYKIGTYYPSDPSINIERQIVVKDKKLKKAIKIYKKNHISFSKKGLK
jgi:hypothetical protein